MNKMEMNMLLNMLSEMDKKDLEMGIAKAQEVLKNKDANSIINDLGKNN